MSALECTVNFLESWKRATDSVKLHLPVFQETKSNSELSCFLACQVRHHFAYGLRRKSRSSNEALDFGTLWHLGMAAWWAQGQTIQQRLDSALAAMATDDPFMLVTLTELVRGYTARWCDSPYVALAIEVEGAMPLVNPDTDEEHPTVGLMGILDKIIQDEDGRLHVMEHKSTSSDIAAGSSYWDRVRSLDSQVSAYLDLARSIGYAVEDVVYDVVSKPTIRPLKATPPDKRRYTKPTKKDPEPRLYANQRLEDETPEEYAVRIRADILENPGNYFARNTIVRLESDELRHRRDTWSLVRQMERLERPAHNRFACSDFGGCEFRDVCEGRASIDDDLLFETKQPRMQLNAHGGG